MFVYRPSIIVRMCFLNVNLIHLIHQCVSQCCWLHVNSSVCPHTELLFPAAASVSSWHCAMMTMEVSGSQSQAQRAAGPDASSRQRC